MTLSLFLNTCSQPPFVFKKKESHPSILDQGRSKGFLFATPIVQQLSPLNCLKIGTNKHFGAGDQFCKENGDGKMVKWPLPLKCNSDPSSEHHSYFLGEKEHGQLRFKTVLNIMDSLLLCTM